VLTVEDIPALRELFLALEGTSPFFTPHPLEALEALRVCSYLGSDLYFGHHRDGEIVAYAMLCGWDDGFEHPSLGIAVHPEFRGTTVGGSVMVALHDFARARGSTKVRLRVHPKNKAARSFYERHGYLFDGEIDRGQLVGWISL